LPRAIKTLTDTNLHRSLFNFPKILSPKAENPSPPKRYLSLFPKALAQAESVDGAIADLAAPGHDAQWQAEADGKHIIPGVQALPAHPDFQPQLSAASVRP
jgi:hypothetical protein